MNTLPRGNFFKNSAVWLVSPNLKGGREIFAPLYSAAMRILQARKLSGYVYKLCEKEIKITYEKTQNNCTTQS